MTILAIIFKILLLIIAFFITILYIVMQFWQKIPSPPVGLKDGLLLGAAGVLFSLGTGQYVGFAVPLVLFLWKILARTLFSRNRIHGRGKWIEIQWQRMTPRGFAERAVMFQDVNRLPAKAHFLIPRVITLLLARYFLKFIRGKMPAIAEQNRVNSKQQQDAMSMVESTYRNVQNLGKGSTEKLNLPFGILKITRL